MTNREKAISTWMKLKHSKIGTSPITRIRYDIINRSFSVDKGFIMDDN